MLNINSEVRINPGDSSKTSLMTVGPPLDVELAWQECEADEDDSE
jgi:hypothetical protein